ncbi:MAG: cytochrome-c oxidase [Gemmatales bacterium]|nr:MAG: cytochrome-c oxidase [Gemmatales bacterium]
MNRLWSILFGVVMTLAVLAFVIAPAMGWWLPENIGTFYGVDTLFYVILATTGFFFVLTEAILVYNIFAFTDRGEKADYSHGNHRLEMFWTAVPGVLLLLLAILQIRTWEEIKYQTRMPTPDHVFEVSARQFEWRIRYPNAIQLDRITSAWQDKSEPALARNWQQFPHYDDVHVVNEVHTWKDANVRIYLKSKDVLHSFYLPNLRLKQDAVPGKTIPVWFRATRANTIYNEQTREWVDRYNYEKKRFDSSLRYDLACAELCGWGHYKMLGRLFVHPDREDYLNWLKSAQEKQRQTQAQ